MQDGKEGGGRRNYADEKEGACEVVGKDKGFKVSGN